MRTKVTRIRALIDAVRRLGPRWVLFRLRYRLEGVLRLPERRSPVGVWAPARSARAPIAVGDREPLKRYLEAHTDQILPCVTAAVDRLRERIFDVYGTKVRVTDWHVEGIWGHRYRSDVHWSRVGELPGADLKLIWEPSRFGWVFDLARAQLIAPELEASDLFWEIFDEWCSASPPNVGVHWSCGQEASLRLIAISACVHLFEGDPEQWGRLHDFAWQTAARVESNIAYAQSQDNNHASSEAAGLLTAALLFPGNESASRWVAVGESALADVCDRLILPDGGSSQYSTNYHRLFVHTLTWVALVYRAVNRSQPDWLIDALDRSTRVLRALGHPDTQQAPFFGADDGTRLLAVTHAHPHTHVGPDVELARALVSHAAPRVDDSAPSIATAPSRVARTEALAWFGLPVVTDQQAVDGIESFPDFGIHVLQHGSFRVVVRCGTTTFRPSHDDQLHIDVWVDAEHVIRDSRTSSYKPADGEPGALRSAEWHNGPRVRGRPAMVSATRFLWGYWPEALLTASAQGPAGVSAEFELLQADGVRLTRCIKVGDSSMEILDSASCRGRLETVWRVGFGDNVRFVGSHGLVEGTGVIGAGYGHSVPCRTLTQVTDETEIGSLRLLLEKTRR